MKKKMMKSLKDLNAYIDNDREKLCDRIHDFELSYNRMRSLLKMILKWLDTGLLDDDFYKEVKGTGTFLFTDLKEVEYIHKRITSELNGLEGYKGLRRNWGYTHKQEPGKYCGD